MRIENMWLSIIVDLSFPLLAFSLLLSTKATRSNVEKFPQINNYSSLVSHIPSHKLTSLYYNLLSGTNNHVRTSAVGKNFSNVSLSMRTTILTVCLSMFGREFG